MIYEHLLIGIIFYSLIVGCLIAFRPKTFWHTMELKDSGKRERIIISMTVLLLIVICTLPMSLSPEWNGEETEHIKQYEKMAVALSKGQLYLDDEPSEELLAMSNPYDTEERESLGVPYLWDHAFYDGNYYMYFGVVPVFLLFLPYFLLTGGASLATYHATQIFVALSIVAIFYMFWLLSKRFFEKISIGLYVMLSVAVSAMSVWYCAAEPALYCTAISSAMCLELWSLCFFIRAVWIVEGENRQIWNAFAGAMLGALTFGCRPTIALANILVLPMLAAYLKGKKITAKLIRKLFLAAVPYLCVGILLMMYNYLRFDSPFEFGQTYQLTVTDQTTLASVSERFTLVSFIITIFKNFIEYTGPRMLFPYVNYQGIFINFPILLLGFIVIWEPVNKKIKEKGLFPFMIMFAIISVIITIFEILWSPELLERYRSDIYFLLGILCFVAVGFWHTTLSSEKNRKKLSFIITILAFGTVLQAVLLFLVPDNGRITAYDPMFLENIRSVLWLGTLYI